MTIARTEPKIETDHGVPVRARNATLQDLATILKDQDARKLDVVAPASQIRAENADLIVRGATQEITLDGVTATDGRFTPTGVADEGIAHRLGIPTAYLRRMRTERPDLYDANVNGWLHGLSDDNLAEASYDHPAPGDGRSFLVRTFTGDDGTGIARAVLSDRYRIVDNLDVLMAALEGIRSAGVNVDIEAADLTDRRMSVRIVSPEVRELAPDILGGYRSPFSGQTGADNPIISAGFVISNSETGGGAFTIVPRLRVEVCKNGLTINKDALRAVHLGGQLDDGVIRWSEDTQRRNLELVTAQARDAVTTFLDVEYMRAKINEIREHAGKPIENAQETIRRVVVGTKIPTGAVDGILNHFIAGGDLTAMGVMAATTSYAQTVEDADVAADVEASALQVLAAV